MSENLALWSGCLKIAVTMRGMSSALFGMITPSTMKRIVSPATRTRIASSFVNLDRPRSNWTILLWSEILADSELDKGMTLIEDLELGGS